MEFGNKLYKITSVFIAPCYIKRMIKSWYVWFLKEISSSVPIFGDTIYIYIYMYVCVCVCARVRAQGQMARDEDKIIY